MGGFRVFEIIGFVGLHLDFLAVSMGAPESMVNSRGV